MRKSALALVTVAATVAACGAFESAGDPSPSGDGGLTQPDPGTDAAQPTPRTDAGQDASPPFDPDLPECPAQRAVVLSGGYGGLAWFTLEWPLRQIIQSPNAVYAYDDVTLAAPVAEADPAHALYARKVNGAPLFTGTGRHPMPTAVVARMNQTHDHAPIFDTATSGEDAIAVGAAAQAVLAPRIPVLRFLYESGHPTYAPLTGKPVSVDVASVAGAIAALGNLTPAERDELTPTATTVDAWTGGKDTSAPIVELATTLVFTARALRMGLVGTVFLPAFEDDPHDAFLATAQPTATDRANALALTLQSFYVELGKSSEKGCGHLGYPLSLADNVVLVVGGDTPKDSFNRVGWSDAINANWVYVRSNGFLRPGWFGDVLSEAQKLICDPVTGGSAADNSDVPIADALAAGIAFAISRGDMAHAKSVTPQVFTGLVASPLP